MPRSSPIIRVGDMVKIVIPDMFVRCGYPLTVDDGEKMVKEDLLKDICRAHGIDEEDHAFYETKRALAIGLLKNRGFGGNERKIYTSTLPEVKGRYGRVTAKSFVKTGERGDPGSCSYSPDGIPVEEYKGMTLLSAKTHVILTLELGSILYSTALNDFPPRIEAYNVQKVYDMPEDKLTSQPMLLPPPSTLTQ